MEENIGTIQEIIIRYLDGSASMEEKTLLLCWLKQSDGNRNDFFTTRDLWLSCNVAVGHELEVDIALEKLKGRILQERERLSISSSTKKKTISLFLRWSGAAAIVLFLLSIGYGIGKKSESATSELLLQNQLITAKGSKGQFLLPDSTVVWLNSETKLTYPSRFTGDKRLVELEGEAYFEVAKDLKKPFIVRTEKIDIEVLGTHFNVNSYAANEYVRTALLSGSVKITGAMLDEPIYLKPDELFEYRETTEATSVVRAKVNLYTQWIQDRLVFDKTPLSEVLTSMEGRYNVEITCREPHTASARVSLTIRQESLAEVLGALSLITPIKYKIEGRKVFIEHK
jgi:transmembrane sensor